MNKYNRYYPYILAMITVTLWGFLFVAAKESVSGMPPFAILTVRFFLVAAILIPFYRKPPIPLKKVFIIALVFGVGHLGTMFWSLHLGLDSSVGIVVDQIGIPISLLLAFFAFGEKPHSIAVLGILLAMIGTFILAGTPNSIGNPIAFSLMVSTGFFWALYSILLKKFNSPSPLGLIAWISLLSFPMLGILSLIFENNQINLLSTATSSQIYSLLYTVFFGLIIAHSIWGYLMTTESINKIVPMILLVPIFGIFGGAICLHEPISNHMILGSFMMILGIGITFIKSKKNEI
ncbi:MAG: EamA family transporter [Rickettsiales bacterium]|jgi:O-acetylserine/cysteine efflux transporter|nr:EamA family transporter [Rickettsiales bacterium]